MHQTYLDDCDSRFNPEIGLVGLAFRNPGYHTHVPSGQWAYPTLDNFLYAGRLLQTGDPANRQRAHGILEKLLVLQDADPVNATYGVWPWLAEEPLAEMSPPDWNWADFCGGAVAGVLMDSREALDGEMIQRLESALHHAAACIFRRNVGPRYTNIAIMGAGVCAAAGEILGEPWLLAYGRRRLEACVAHSVRHHGFTEYNSPAYTPIVIMECERIAHLVRDARCLECAEELRRTAWRVVAEHFHPATQQWAGPHARAYKDLVDANLAHFLEARTGVPVACMAEPEAGIVPFESLGVLPCPEEFLPAFRESVREPEERRVLFVREDDEALSRYGTTWLTRAACLGSVNYDNFWTQMRPLIGYWPAPEGGVAVLRLRFLKDGRDFCSGLIRNVQKQNRVLSALNLAVDLGDWHPNLDAPKDGVFPARDVRLRYELRGCGARVNQLEERLFCLECGDWKAWLRTAPGIFGAAEVRWEAGQDETGCFVDAVCLGGSQTTLRPREIAEIRVGAALELFHEGEIPSGGNPEWTVAERSQTLRWEGLEVSVPLGAECSR